MIDLKDPQTVKEATRPTIIPLYPAGSMPSLGVPETRVRSTGAGDLIILNVSDPKLELFRPAPGKANGTAVIVAPGGGFVGIGYEAGGTAIAQALAQALAAHEASRTDRRNRFRASAKSTRPIPQPDN